VLLAPVAIALPDLLCRHTGLIEPPTRRDTVNIHKHPTAVDDIFGGALPHNIEAEQCLIGAIFNNNDAFAAIKGLVTAEDFFEPINREIFNICGDLIRAGKLANPITVKTFLPPIS
jgi:replicative DNA helicase